MDEQKRWLLGLEAELFTLDTEGFMTNKADLLIKRLKVGNMPAYIKKECGRNMIELLAPPNVSVASAIQGLLDNMQQAIEAADTLGIRLYSCGTYPGAFIPRMRSDGLYGVKKKAFGAKFRIGGRCIGFHCHFDTPSSIPFAKDIRLLGLLDLKQQAGIMNGYNFLIASEPILACLMQSSPFYQGVNVGKDCRVIAYRGGRHLHFPLGMYAEHEAFGQLQGYKHSIMDIIGMAEQKFEEWGTLVKSVGFNLSLLARYGSVLSTSWNPVKINPHNTLEQRGMDINLPSYLAAATTAIKSILSAIYAENLEVTPCDHDAFKAGDNRLFIPPEHEVREQLQYLSAYRGLAERKIRDYCRAFCSLARAYASAEERMFLKPFFRCINERSTRSDEIISLAKRKGWERGTHLDRQAAAELSLILSEHLRKDLKRMLLHAS